MKKLNEQIRATKKANVCVVCGCNVIIKLPKRLIKGGMSSFGFKEIQESKCASCGHSQSRTYT